MYDHQEITRQRFHKLNLNGVRLTPRGVALLDRSVADQLSRMYDEPY